MGYDWFPVRRGGPAQQTQPSAPVGTGTLAGPSTRSPVARGYEETSTLRAGGPEEQQWADKELSDILNPVEQ